MKASGIFTFITISLILISACSTAPQNLHEGAVVLRAGETASNDDGSVKITFIEVVEDSRCATGVECVWAGQVKVLLEVALGTEIQQYTLTTGTLLEGDTDSIIIGGYNITLTQVDPYPLFEQLTNPANYRINLDIQIR